jgi:N4-(beta-N-acetylglucosaminyl)-L-asparaginase
MHGPSRRAGAVASLRYIKNPSSVAKLVLERTDHILLVGEGALRFALKHGFQKQDLLTEKSRKAWLAWRESLNPKDNWGPSWHKTAPASGAKTSQAQPSQEEVALNAWIEEILRNRPTGTINCLAVDANGDISGVTTTSGLAWKIPGRVGDSPLIGCGTYADDWGAASCTGQGEAIIRLLLAKCAVDFMKDCTNPEIAATMAVKLLEDKRIAATGGIILVNRSGKIGYARNTSHMPVCQISGKEDVLSAC